MPAKDISQIVERALGALCLFSHVAGLGSMRNCNFCQAARVLRASEALCIQDM